MLDRNAKIYLLIAAVLLGACQPLNAFWWLFNDWSRDQKLYNAYQKKDYTAIKKQLTQELIEKPFDPELNYKVGDAQAHLKEYDAAHASFKRVSERCSDHQKDLKERALTRQAAASCDKAQASLGKDWKTKKVDEKIIDAAIAGLELGIAEYDSALALNPAAEPAKKDKERAETLIKELREKKEEQQNNDQDNNQDQDKQDKQDQQQKQDKDQKKDSQDKQSSDKKDQQEQSSDDKKQDGKESSKKEDKDKKEKKDRSDNKDTDQEKPEKEESAESDKKRDEKGDQGKEEKDERSGDDEKPEKPDQDKPNKESGSSEDKKDDGDMKDQESSAAGDKDEERSAKEAAAGAGEEKEGEESASKAAQEAQHEDTAQALHNKGMVALLKSLDKDEAKLQKRRIMIQTRGDQRNSARGQKPW